VRAHRREERRLPVPPLLADLAAWSWRLLLVGAACWLLLQVFLRLELVTVPLAAMILLCALLWPGVALLRDHGVPRVLATLVVLVLAVVVAGLVVTWVVDQAMAQSGDLASELGDSVSRLPVRSSTLVHLRDQVVQEIGAHRSDLTQQAITGVVTGARLLTGAVLTILLTVIALADGDRMWTWCLRLLGRRARVVVGDAAQHAFFRLSGWVRGTVLIAVFHSVVVAVTLLVLRVPLVAPLAVVVFIGSFVPLAGALLAGGLAVLVSFAAQGPVAALVLLVVLLVDNQVEAHLLLPFLVGRYVRLHPFVVALAVPTGALLGGLPGTLLAVPVTAALHAALQRVELPRADARPHRGGAATSRR
jgi:predicted PurR-regulated permease PerM